MQSFKALEPTQLARYFKSPVTVSLDELVLLRELAGALQRGSKRRVRTGRTGAAVTKILGRGLDFAEVRSYQPGDDVRMIDWKVTARSGDAHTKLFVEERERPFFVVIDARSAMHFATQKMYKSVLAARLGALLGWSAVAHNDCVGGLVFTEQRHFEVKPQAGRRGLMSLFRAIVNAHADASIDSSITAGGQTNPVAGQGKQSHRSSMSGQFRRLRHLAPTGCSICILSDFNGFDEKSMSALGPLLQRCDVLAAMINDPLELSLPDAGQYCVTDAYKRVGISTRNKVRQAEYAESQQALIENVSEFFSRRRGRFTAVSTNDDIAAIAIGLLQQTALGS